MLSGFIVKKRKRKPAIFPPSFSPSFGREEIQMWNTAFALGLHGDSINTSAFLWRLKAPCTEFIIERNERHYYFMLKHFSDRIERIQLNVVGVGHGAVFCGYHFQQSRLQATGSKALPHRKLESLGTMHQILNWYHGKKNRMQCPYSYHWKSKWLHSSPPFSKHNWPIVSLLSRLLMAFVLFIHGDMSHWVQ